MSEMSEHFSLGVPYLEKTFLDDYQSTIYSVFKISFKIIFKLDIGHAKLQDIDSEVS